MFGSRKLIKDKRYKKYGFGRSWTYFDEFYKLKDENQLNEDIEEYLKDKLQWRQIHYNLDNEFSQVPGLQKIAFQLINEYNRYEIFKIKIKEVEALEQAKNEFKKCTAREEGYKKSEECFVKARRMKQDNQECKDMLEKHFMNCWKTKFIPAAEEYYNEAVNYLIRIQDKFKKEEEEDAKMAPKYKNRQNIGKD